jgi:hypothetical protein
MKIQQRYLRDQGYEGKIFVDLDSDVVYRRICIGFAWPYLNKPGFICVMAEEDKRDFSIPYGPRHLRILAEHETDDIENLSRYLQKFTEDFCQKNIVGNDKNPLCEVMEQYQDKHARLYIRRPYQDELDLTVFVQLIQKRTRSAKTLHFQEESSLPGCLTNLHTDDLENKLLEQYPALYALGLCLSEMEFNRVAERNNSLSRRSRSSPQSGWAA